MTEQKELSVVLEHTLHRLLPRHNILIIGEDNQYKTNLYTNLLYYFKHTHTIDISTAFLNSFPSLQKQSSNTELKSNANEYPTYLYELIHRTIPLRFCFEYNKTTTKQTCEKIDRITEFCKVTHQSMLLVFQCSDTNSNQDNPNQDNYIIRHARANYCTTLVDETFPKYKRDDIHYVIVVPTFTRQTEINFLYKTYFTKVFANGHIFEDLYNHCQSNHLCIVYDLTTKSNGLFVYKIDKTIFPLLQ